ncbi:MAG: CopG family transcriptional regulator [Candidatus Altiarchaeota archaeon]
MSSEKTRYTTVSIPIELAEKAKKQIKGTGFKNLSDYVAYLLREIVASRRDWDEGDLEKVKERLRALGYL